MKVSHLHTSLLLALSVSFDVVVGKAGILINPPGLAALPSLKQATTAATTVGLALSNIQGDILIGMKKNKELFFFFQIKDVPTFKSHLSTDIHPLITNVPQLLSNDTQPGTMVNIAFSQAGLNALGVTDQLGDSLFSAGQAAGATDLGDGPLPGTTNWVPAFSTAGSIHGVLILASDTTDNINSQLATLQGKLGASITESYRLLGEARPNDQNGHEHFGFKDGISQPAINGFNGVVSGVPLFPGPPGIDPGNILVGEAGDGALSSRPSWAKDGSFLVFRQLKQLVPEFNSFLQTNAPSDMTPELLGARMVGRWKSGAPIDLSPLADDPALGNDNTRNNNFNFTHPGTDFTSNQENCPFSAHVRKTNPRADLANGAFPANHIIRSGIPYGPEVSAAEAAAGVSDNSVERGLAFVAYQSSITNGFHKLQQAWANAPGFIFNKNVKPGFDPIIGANLGAARGVVGLDPSAPTGTITLQKDFVVSRGGEYFFSPPISALLTPLGA